MCGGETSKLSDTDLAPHRSVKHLQLHTFEVERSSGIKWTCRERGESKTNKKHKKRKKRNRQTERQIDGWREKESGGKRKVSGRRGRIVSLKEK